MALRFKEEHLVKEDGTYLEISYEELIQACLLDTYKTISVKEIIFTAIYSITGEKVVDYRCRDSSLFNRLEDEILKDSRYLESKEQFIKERSKYSSKTNYQEPFLDSPAFRRRERKKNILKIKGWFY